VAVATNGGATNKGGSRKENKKKYKDHIACYKFSKIGHYSYKHKKDTELRG